MAGEWSPTHERTPCPVEQAPICRSRFCRAARAAAVPLVGLTGALRLSLTALQLAVCTRLRTQAQLRTVAFCTGTDP